VIGCLTGSPFICQDHYRLRPALSRPKSVFFELVEVDGVQIQRFEEIH
jgi:hypothetical protein